MLFGETVAVCCENHTEHKHALCVPNAQFPSVQTRGTYSNHQSLNGKIIYSS
jgi:hypothetical protein